MFIGTTGLFILFIALFFIGVRNEENERIAREANEAKDD